MPAVQPPTMSKRPARSATKKRTLSKVIARAPPSGRLSKPGMDKERKAVRLFLDRALLEPRYSLTDIDDEEYIAFDVGAVGYDLQDKLVVLFTMNGDLQPWEDVPNKLAKLVMDELVSAKPELVPSGFEITLHRV